MRYVRLLTLTIVSLWTLLATAQLAAANIDKLEKRTDELIEASGHDLHIKQIPLALQQAARQQSGPASAFVRPLMSAMGKVFDPDTMMNTFRTDLRDRLDMETLIGAMKWYRSDNGQAITNAQRAILQPEVMAQVAGTLLKQDLNISAQREKMIRQLAENTKANAIALDLMVSMQAAFMAGLSSLIAPNQALDYQSLYQSFDQQKQSMKSQLEQQLVLQQGILLRQLPDSTLQEFLAFSQTEVGQKLFLAIHASLNHTIQQTALSIPKTMSANAP